jgi:hypothetical protein
MVLLINCCEYASTILLSDTFALNLHLIGFFDVCKIGFIMRQEKCWLVFCKNALLSE